METPDVELRRRTPDKSGHAQTLTQNSQVEAIFCTDKLEKTQYVGEETDLCQPLMKTL